MIPVLTPSQSAEWDARASAAGAAAGSLMDAAGRASAAVVAARYGPALRGGVLLAVGTGNNGGDGWVLARALHRLDVPVWVSPLAGQPSPLNAQARALALADGVRTVAPDGPWPAVSLVVDAILGTGASGAPRPPVASFLERLRDLRLPVVALDGPTGVDLLTGATWGPAGANLSITFGAPRRGHLLARDEVGDVVVVDIGLPDPGAEWPLLMTDSTAAEWLAPFPARAHKGDRGRVVIVGGAPGMVGALRMAGRGAFAAGAGLVYGVGPGLASGELAGAEPDLQLRSHPLEGQPSAELAELAGSADALVIGPGLGRDPNRRGLLEAVIRGASATVLDADGLAAFQGALPRLRELGAGRHLVLTPHPGEFRALFPHLAGSLDTDPWGAAEAASAEIGATILLKGVPSVVAQAGQPMRTIAAGNPGLATGGSGDVLAGICGALLAAGLQPSQAAALAAQALGRAADIAARRHTARAMRPLDVIEALPDLWRAWAVLRTSPPRVVPPVLLELERPRS
ncbi:MAG TPA: NAD(P)H-hydrate dehydratase [Gemmatimonadales bacterium]|nr:NAD(P)H-hydrate dehydratase [Gemmatimonadales bacterium]